MANVWRDAIPSTTLSQGGTSTSVCEQYYVPAGTLVFYDEVQQATVSVVIDSSGSYVPDCNVEGYNSQTSSENHFESLGQTDEPFYGSVIPIAYTISATTIVAWLLFILLLIAKKRRPWFQMFMMLFVATSLTVFLARATRFLEHQYSQGYHDAEELRHHIFGSLSFRILEVLAVLIIWLAHLQVLLRLFNRAKERLVIKWTGVTLAIIDTLFWCLVNFYVPYNTDNHTVRDVIPVLAYLFQITIQVVYAGAVIVYSIRKRKFAYHRTALITAIISLCAILMPLIFFIMDIAEYWITGWSEFIRWVTDAAASVVVWEWVDAIERLEKEHQQTGVLGRQIYEDERAMDFRNKRGRSTGSSTSPDGSPPKPDENGTDSNKRGHAVVKRFEGRSLLPSFLRTRNGWIISRTGSTNSTATFYGNEIRLASFGPTSRPPTSENEARSPQAPDAPQPSNIHMASPPSNRPVTTPSPCINPHPPMITPTPEPPALSQNTTPVRITPTDNTSTSADPQLTPPPLKRHMHPLRRSSRRQNPMPEALVEHTATSSSPTGLNPNVGNSEAGVANIEPTPQADTDEEEDEEETYTVIRSEGFDLQPSFAARNRAPSPPPSFVPNPGFSAGDYWDDKQHPPPT